VDWQVVRSRSSPAGGPFEEKIALAMMAPAKALGNSIKNGSSLMHGTLIKFEVNAGGVPDLAGVRSGDDTRKESKGLHLEGYRFSELGGTLTLTFHSELELETWKLAGRDSGGFDGVIEVFSGGRVARFGGQARRRAAGRIKAGSSRDANQKHAFAGILLFGCSRS